MKLKYSTKLASFSFCLVVGTAAPVAAQDNPLLQQNQNPLLQQNATSADALFDQQARAIDAAATKTSSDPVCQNIRANYDQELAKIVDKSGSDVSALSQINQFQSRSGSATYRLNRINRNLTGNSSSALGKASNSIGRGLNVANDVAAIGGMFGISGKMSQKKAAKKAAKLDAQALDAVQQMGCPMSTFG